jgi:magnesium-transporting ATPase (P-type)
LQLNALAGFGKILVTAVGENTDSGKAQAVLKAAPPEPTPLQSKLDGMAAQIGAHILLTHANGWKQNARVMFVISATKCTRTLSHLFFSRSLLFVNRSKQNKTHTHTGKLGSAMALITFFSLVIRFVVCRVDAGTWEWNELKVILSEFF